MQYVRAGNTGIQGGAQATIRRANIVAGNYGVILGQSTLLSDSLVTTTGGAGGAIAVNGTAPSLTALKLSPKTLKSKATLTFTLSEPATVTITFGLKSAGKKHGKSCVKPTAKLKEAKSCTRLVTKATLTKGAAEGRREAVADQEGRDQDAVRGRVHADRDRRRRRQEQGQGDDRLTHGEVDTAELFGAATFPQPGRRAVRRGRLQSFWRVLGDLGRIIWLCRAKYER